MGVDFGKTRRKGLEKIKPAEARLLQNPYFEINVLY